jgi:hypothetical protein
VRIDHGGGDRIRPGTVKWTDVEDQSVPERSEYEVQDHRDVVMVEFAAGRGMVEDRRERGVAAGKESLANEVSEVACASEPVSGTGIAWSPHPARCGRYDLASLNGCGCPVTMSRC